MGTYPPRECGIATFNQDLFNSSQKYLGDIVACRVAAMNFSTLDTYIYPNEVEWTIDQDNIEEYKNLAFKFNSDPLVTGVIIQHEYGIYGGVDGENILSFVENCKKPIVVTLHTVLPTPTETMKDVTSRIITQAKTIIVLTENSKKILEDLYPHATGKVHVIPHGVHATEFEETTNAKKKLNLKEKTILSTFGLLSRGKGIEYVIRSLPKVIKEHPDVLYLILGETHPVVRRNEGESYRKELASLVTELNLKNHVKFYDQYLTLTDLIEFLKATDVYISTSINPNQAVSGTLSYALGTGRAVISTEFAQAKEIVTKDSGRLVPFMNEGAYSGALLELLANKEELKQMHKAAYKQTRPMLWSSVANQYSKLLTQNILPNINLTHLKEMTDNFGLFQFAEFAKPNKEFGYTLDDNARALVVCSWLDSKTYPEVRSLAKIYLNFIAKCQLDDGSFVNYLEHPNHTPTDQNKKEDLTDATARTMWALSEVLISKHSTSAEKDVAKNIFMKALPNIKFTEHPRASAFMIKALANILEPLPETRKLAQEQITAHADFLLGKLEKNSNSKWQWFESALTYNNAVLSEALLIAGGALNNSKYKTKGIATLDFLIDKTFSQNHYIPIGHSHWYKDSEKRSHFDQQPEDPASMILALSTAHDVTDNEKYKKLMSVCFSWFLGNNILEKALYNSENGGCFDGLHPDRVNQNQGAESLVSYLLARITITKIKK